MAFGKANLQCGGRFNDLFPNKYRITGTRRASGQSVNGASAKSSKAGRSGNTSNWGCPSPLDKSWGINVQTFSPKRFGYTLSWCWPWLNKTICGCIDFQNHKAPPKRQPFDYPTGFHLYMDETSQHPGKAFNIYVIRSDILQDSSLGGP